MSSSVEPERTNRSVEPAAPPSPPAPTQGQPTPLESMLRELRMHRHSRGNVLGASFGSALESIWANRLRSLLTMVGIIIGVAAVIGALTLTQGVGAYATNLISGRGTNTIFIQSGNASQNGKGPTDIHPLSQQDYLTIQQQQHIVGISPRDSLQEQVVYGNQNYRTSVVGVSTDMQLIQDWNVAQGLWFSKQEETGGEQVAVLGDTPYQNLFGPSGVNPIGQKIRIGTQVFRVVGVLQAKGQSGFGTGDDQIFIPYKAAQSRFKGFGGGVYFSEIDVQVDTTDDVNLVVQEITTALETNHHIPRGGLDDFRISTSQQLMQQLNQEIAGITLLLVGIAAISLTVGGIGIMNIMIVAVTERTREIGIRMSIGARRGDIRNQFMVEALILCLLGGLLGLGLGVLAGWGTTTLIAAASSGRGGAGSPPASLPLVITPTTLILPFAVSVIIGLVFGIYPAIRASRLDPIVALRRRR